MSPPLRKSDLFATLPPAWPHDLLPSIRNFTSRDHRKLVVLDDDPTGTQTVYGIPVLTTWDTESLHAEFQRPERCFYILTNSRSLPPEGAVELTGQISNNLKQAAGTTEAFSIVSRSDSTLRGHFPAEPLTLSQNLGPFDAIILVPYFEAGGRYTIGDVHYVAEGDMLVPAGETPFAQDHAFGYRSSNLKAWVAEKFNGACPASAVESISISDLREGGPERIRQRLNALKGEKFCVVNAACPRDLEVFILGLLQAEADGKRFLFRTAASFVAARLGLEARSLWVPPAQQGAGLTVVGSYVPKTTAQLEALLRQPNLAQVELSVEALLDPANAQLELSRAATCMNNALAASEHAVVFTSRKLVQGSSGTESLAIGRRISDALVELVRKIETRPAYLIAKGGITSSDIATRGLGVKRAMVLGQILPGVPVWQLGPESRFPNLPYVVFPGNVGDRDALTLAVARFRTA